MAVKQRNIKSFKKLSMPVSYCLLAKDKLYDARNIFDNKDVTETRHGIKRYNSTTLGGSLVSGSYFKTSAGNRYKLAKIGTEIYSTAASGAHGSAIKTGLTAANKHRGVTMNDRHIIGVGSDGLFSYNGTIFTQLGQAPPTAPTVAVSAGGALPVSTVYQVGITFYASGTGFETNVSGSAQVTTAGANLQIAVSVIPSTAPNGTIDTVRIYLKNITTNSAYLFIAAISLGTTTHTISAVPTSTQIPPTKNAAPISGGGKYLSVFGKCIAYAGNTTYKNDVFISEEYLPDAYDDTTTSKTLEIPGQGEITGIGVGLYDNNYLSPFMVIFKKTTTVLYSELGGTGVQTTIDEHVGCVSHDTIKVRNGIVTFMSENGWYQVHNGALVKKRLEDGSVIPRSLGDGDIDDIFSREGWAYQLNASQYSSFFSAYYSTLGHYITFIAEGGNSSFYKAYVFEERIGGFRVYEFKTPFTCAFEGEDDSGNQCVFFGDGTGYLFTHSVKNSRHDEDIAAASQTIPAFAYLPFTTSGEDSISCNFKTLAVKALNSSNVVTVKAFPGYSLVVNETSSFDFSNSTTGFVLDLSMLDVDVLGDERVPTTYMASINRTGEAMIIGFFQDILDANMGLISSELTWNRNGNRNL